MIKMLKAMDLSGFLTNLLEEAMVEFARESTPEGGGIVGELIGYNHASGFKCAVEVPATAENNEKLFDLKTARHIYIQPVQRMMFSE